MSKKFPFYGTTLEYSDDMILYNDLRSNFYEAGLHYQKAFNKMIDESVERYKSDGDYDSYFATSVNNMSETASLAVEFSIFTLMQYGVDTYDRERFISLFDDDSGENLFQKLGIWEPIDNYVAIQLAIEEHQEGVANQRQEERSNRGKYVNLFSTDVRSAVSGEISAGIMNAGLGVVRGLKDAWQDSDDKRRMKEAIDEIVFDKKFHASFTEAVPVPFMRCFLKVAIILWENKIMKCPFSDDYIDNRDAYISKIKNYAEFGEKDTAFNLIKDYLQQDPYNTLIYKLAYTLQGDNKYDLIRLADYFDVWRDYAYEIEHSVNDENIYDYLYDYSIESKITDLELELAEYKNTHLV